MDVDVLVHVLNGAIIHIEEDPIDIHVEFVEIIHDS